MSLDVVDTMTGCEVARAEPTRRIIDSPTSKRDGVPASPAMSDSSVDGLSNPPGSLQ